MMNERYNRNWNNKHEKCHVLESSCRITNLTKLVSFYNFVPFFAFERESRKFLEASRVEAHNSEGEVQLNSTGPREMAGVEGVVYAVLSAPITSLSSFFPSGSGIRDRAPFKRGVSAKAERNDYISPPPSK